MTTFILVPGAHTGGWVWREVADRLRAAGATAYPVTLTGAGAGTGVGAGTSTGIGTGTGAGAGTGIGAGTSTGAGAGDPAEPAPAAGPGTDLETHIADVLRLIDAVDTPPEVGATNTAGAAGAPDTVDAPDPPDSVHAPDIVLVGHGYGIHPAVGAADRRPDRVARVVHLDVGIPQDGDPPLRLVPDQAFREQLAKSAGAAGGAAGPGDDWRVPPPPRDGWQRWGSTAGLSDEALTRLTARAEPQPLGTLTQPLRLSGAVLGLPVTGVLCVGNGSSIAMVEGLVGMRDPRFKPLTDPRVTFFELDTGHWPMLSAPDELAAVLLRAAAGEGHHVAWPAAEEAAHLRPFLVDLPERPRERVGLFDLHLPDADGPRPAVVFVHGGPVPEGVRPTPRDWSAYVGYARFAATLGVVGVTLDHRLHDLTDFGRAADDVAAAVEAVRADPRVDGERVALWFFSAGGLLSADWLAAPPPWLRCLAATYPMLAPMPSWGLAGSRFHPATAVRGAGGLPIVLTRVGRERPEIAVTVEEFLAAATDSGAAVELIDIPLGRHGFETTDHSEPARHAVHEAMRSVVGHLRI